MRGAPQDPGAARAHQPFVAAGGEEVDAGAGKRDLLGPERVDGVDTQQDAPAVPRGGVAHGARDRVHRQLHAGARVTHVSAIARVRGRIAALSRAASSSAEALAGSAGS